MPRTARLAPGGWAYPIPNRSVAREPLFRKAGHSVAVARNRPSGSALRQKRTADRPGLTASLRPEGRPKTERAKTLDKRPRCVPVSKLQSTFATVRLQHRKTNGSGSRVACLTMAFKLMESASKTWRTLNGSTLAADVITGVQFTDGVQKAAARSSGHPQTLEISLSGRSVRDEL